MTKSTRRFIFVSFLSAAALVLWARQNPVAAADRALPENSTVNNQTLLNPAAATAQAPDTYQARFTTTKGDFVIEVNRAWAPKGADRFYNLVKMGYFDGDAFFRVVQGFMVQFGINGSPQVNAAWKDADIADDPAVGRSNTTGMVTFATAGPNTRTTQIFINYGNNAGLDSQGFTPFGQITSGMDVVEALYAGYGDGPPSGNGPDQDRIQNEGNAYLQASFPQMDYVKTAAIEGGKNQEATEPTQAPAPTSAAPAKKPWWQF